MGLKMGLGFGLGLVVHSKNAGLF